MAEWACEVLKSGPDVWNEYFDDNANMNMLEVHMLCVAAEKALGDEVTSLSFLCAGGRGCGSR